MSKKSLNMSMYLASYHLYKKKIPVLPGILMRLNRVLFSCDIPYTAEIGESTVFNHSGLACVIHERAKIGENCLIQQGVTIGGNGTKGVPVVGNNVFIGAGAKVLGGILIGDNSKIGANAVVMTDVPPNATAVGIPARIIFKNQNTEHTEQ